MAAPMVSGLAALIREYYPKLTAVQVREIIMNSVVKSDYLKDKCVSGGVINVYNALKLAETYKKKSDVTFSSNMSTGF
jgi:subtilisin family serine protease